MIQVNIYLEMLRKYTSHSSVADLNSLKLIRGFATRIFRLTLSQKKLPYFFVHIQLIEILTKLSLPLFISFHAFICKRKPESLYNFIQTFGLAFMFIIDLIVSRLDTTTNDLFGSSFFVIVNHHLHVTKS